MKKNIGNIFFHKWIRISLFNLLLVSFVGVVLRYKIAFSLPIVDQKYLLNAHSHFAFSGWISQILMALLVGYLNRQTNLSYKKYKWLLYGNLATAYGMLFSFPFQGYGTVSIIFSTLSIVVAYIFAVVYWKDLDKIKEKNISHSWFKAALLFNAVSSLGAFALSFLMANDVAGENWYLLAVYFFLHFQYNGWFFFACMGLFYSWLTGYNIQLKQKRLIFWLFTPACVPAYFLSVLWLPMPVWIYVLIVLAAIAQVIGLILIIKSIIPHLKIFKEIIGIGRALVSLSAVALSAKLLLQLGSTIPSLSKLAFGFRPIVIGYLHLVLLGVITLFIIGFMVINSFINLNKLFRYGTIVFVSGIIVNEVLLMMQGIMGMNYKSIPYISEMLLSAAIIMFSGLLILVWSQKSTPVRA
ncbi:MAG TPA: hypothetical protein VH396_09720 [Chitinophagaceae bacterium]